MHRFNVDITNVSHGNYADCSNSVVILRYADGAIPKPSHLRSYLGTLALNLYLNKFIPLN